MKWISIKKQLPTIPPKYWDADLEGYLTPTSVRVICYDGEDVFECFFYDNGLFQDEGVTHWQPLPQPPAE